MKRQNDSVDRNWVPGKVILVHGMFLSKGTEGGAVRYVRGILESLDAYGIQTELWGYEDEGTSEYENIMSRPVSRKETNWLIFLTKLAMVIRKSQICRDDIVHLQRSYFSLPFIMLHPGIKTVITLHMKPLEFLKVSYPVAYRLLNPIHKIVDGYCLRRASALIAVSDEIAHSYAKRYGSEVELRTSVVPLGINLRRFTRIPREAARTQLQVSDQTKMLLFVGRLEPIKGVEFIIDSYSAIQSMVSTTRLYIVGRGSQEASLRVRARKLCSPNSVIFLGEKDPDFIPAIMNAADVLLIASRTESSPFVAREAIACGLPIVSLDVGDINELAQDFRGLTVTPNDRDAFCAGILHAISDEGENRVLDNLANQEGIKALGIDSQVESLLDIYRRIGD